MGEKNQELIHKLKDVKKSIVSKELRGDDWEDAVGREETGGSCNLYQ